MKNPSLVLMELKSPSCGYLFSFFNRVKVEHLPTFALKPRPFNYFCPTKQPHIIAFFTYVTFPKAFVTYRKSNSNAYL